MSSNPVYGLIFLFRWREDNDGKQEATCPDGLWFANQVSPLFFIKVESFLADYIYRPPTMLVPA